ncbi:polyphosphate--nucleotide phosphotransferase [Caenimonas sedimenti]|uniref:Polyphosphate--nucleotide phosphotransferase n=1 Tax=Caenimonas sedimenti TaxID=2596921 RepID=A0A562ZKK2_9BURK|nr:PPK2 family polyphosphate kinase [Caenimonas sedimenti]TWO68855.1 polyphosphate--nucleotide phosphotransferase [Caenimonas sedimenti]
MAKPSSRAPALADWQPPAGKRAASFRLKDIDPAAKPWSSGDKALDVAAVEKLAVELDGLQNLLYADRRFKVLVVLQGTDTAGKDGTVRGVFARTSPLGVHTVGWKAPTEEERGHDYLWRIHKAMPGAGEITVFNRSHYEDVLVPAVNQWISADVVAQRYRQINDFERMLTENGTLVLKFMLHISAEEQRTRLQERLDDPAKRWKFSMGDVEVRKQWADYQKAYQSLLRATSTEWAPWTIVPADSKTHRNLMIATVVRDALKKLKLRYPPGDPALKGLVIA